MFCSCGALLLDWFKPFGFVLEDVDLIVGEGFHEFIPVFHFFSLSVV